MKYLMKTLLSLIGKTFFFVLGYALFIISHLLYGWKPLIGFGLLAVVAILVILWSTRSTDE